MPRSGLMAIESVGCAFWDHSQSARSQFSISRIEARNMPL